MPFRGAGLRKALTAGCCAILLLAPAEVIARRLLRGRPPIDGVQNRLFRYDARLGWFPRERSGGFLTVNTRIFVRHNSNGFRDRERGARFAVGMQDADADVSGFLSRSGIPWVSLEPVPLPERGTLDARRARGRRGAGRHVPAEGRPRRRRGAGDGLTALGPAHRWSAPAATPGS